MAKLQVPITKAKGQFVEIDTDALPQDVFTEAVLQGLKVLANRGTSKITKASYPNADELKAAAQAKAEEQVQLMMENKIKLTGQKKAGGVTGAVRTEAMRLARQLVKDEMKRAGIKISHVEASEITKAAKELLDAMPDLIEQAQQTIAARQSEADKVKSAINITELVKANPALVAKAEAKKAKDKAGTISAKQAGQVQTRKKGQAAQAAQ